MNKEQILAGAVGIGKTKTSLELYLYKLRGLLPPEAQQRFDEFLRKRMEDEEDEEREQDV